MGQMWSGVAKGLALVALVALAGCGNRLVLSRAASSASAVTVASTASVASPTLGGTYPDVLR